MSEEGKETAERKRDDVRREWLRYMLKIADPVLEALAEGRLKKELPVSFHPERAGYQPLEAFGRMLDGLAPWLEAEVTDEEEKSLQEKYRELARRCLVQACDPQSPDYMDFGDSDGQPLVDTAFLAHAIVRAPEQLYEPLKFWERRAVTNALKKSRRITPCPTNWLFFSAMTETALAVMRQEDVDRTRIDYAVRMFENWYLGDGVYGDGPEFHWDYYNSYVIQPMYTDIMRVFQKERDYGEIWPKVRERAARYAQVLERMIGPDGTYPVLGRSSVYRFGAFQMLGQAALEHFLPETLPPEQVRTAMTAVLRRVMRAEDMFDENGWLRPGVFGFQPEMAEEYIGTGSLYLCMTAFLPLGLPEEDPFWSNPDMDWTGKKIWTGQAVVRDHSI